MITIDGRWSSAESVNSSMIGGNIRANELLANAPIRAINKSRCGITMAIAPVNKQTKHQTMHRFILIHQKLF